MDASKNEVTPLDISNGAGSSVTEFSSYEKWMLWQMQKLHISFTQENVICISKHPVPLFVKFVASLGMKFNYIGRPHDVVPVEEFSNSFDKILDRVNSFEQHNNVKNEIKMMYENLKMLHDTNATPAQKFIRQMAEKTMDFLKVEKNIVISPADKGGKIVIMDRSTYDVKVYEHIEANVRDHTYYHWRGADIHDCRRFLEPKYEKIRYSLNHYFALDVQNNFKNCCYPLRQEPYVIAKLKILLKIHKEGMPGRPIVAAPDCWARDLSSWILKKLQLIASLFDGFQVRSSEEFIHKISELPLRMPDHRLSTWDYESMFTNIPFPFTKRVISDHYAVIAEETTVPLNLFLDAVSFLIEDSCYFTFKDEIYRQTRCLTMGNRISQVLADIATNFATKQAVDIVGMENISFLAKYVDDFAGAMNEMAGKKFEEELTKPIKGLRIKRVNESLDGSITFLDSLIQRDKCNIKTKWWQKDCSARQIMNFHSYHPTEMKKNVVYEFIRHAIAITSPVFVQETIKSIKKTLRRSSYPPNFTEPMIKDVLRKFGKVVVKSSIGSPDQSIDFVAEIEIRDADMAGLKGKECVETKYVPVPLHSKNMLYKIKEFTRRHHVDCKIAPRTTRSNRHLIFSKLKDKTHLSCIKFAIFSMKCRKCNFVHLFRTFNLDVIRTMKHQLCRNDSPLKAHVLENPGHYIMRSPFNIEKFNNVTDLQFAFNRVRQ